MERGEAQKNLKPKKQQNKQTQQKKFGVSEPKSSIHNP